MDERSGPSLSESDRGLLNWLTIVGAAAGAVVLYFVFGGPERGWLYDYQGLVGGLLALAAAGITVWQIRAQVEQTERLAREQLERDHYAARAVLPPALMQISDYAKRCVRELRSNAFMPKDLPEAPFAAVPAVRECVRFADGERRRELGDLLAHLQIQVSRTQSARPSDFDWEHWRLRLVVDAIELYGRASSLFAYGRRKEDDPLQGLWDHARNCGVFDDAEEALDQYINEASDRFAQVMNLYRAP